MYNCTLILLFVHFSVIINENTSGVFNLMLHLSIVVYTNWLNETNSSISHKPLCNISSLGLCTPRVAWWREITSASGSVDTWTFSRAFPLPTCLEGLRNRSVTQAGTVCCSKGNPRTEPCTKNKYKIWYWSFSRLSTGVLKAKEYRNRCLQVNLPMTDTRGSEDCLYLNIWVPHGSSGIENAAFVIEMTDWRLRFY